MSRHTSNIQTYLRQARREGGEEVGEEGLRELWEAWHESWRWDGVEKHSSKKLRPVWRMGRWMTASEWMSIARCKSGYRGVKASGRKGKPWRVTVGGRYGGCFAELEDAVRASDRLARAVYGPKAMVNWPDH